MTTQGQAMTIDTLIDHLFFPERPRWHDGEQQLYFSDILNNRVYRTNLSGKIELVLTAPNWISGLGWLDNGDLLAVIMHEQRLIRLPSADVHTGNCQINQSHTMRTYTPLPSIANDVVMLPDGTTYSGSFNRA